MSIPVLKNTYLIDVVPALQKSLGYDNIHQVPKIEKVVINSSFGDEMDNDESHESFKVVNTRQLFQSKKHFSYTILFFLKLSTSMPNDS